MTEATKAGTETIAALRAELARLADRVAALEAAAAPHTTRPAAVPAAAPPAPAPGPEPLSEELVLVIGAAIAAFLGKRAHIRQIQLVEGASWAHAGRVSIQASHAPVHNR